MPARIAHRLAALVAALAVAGTASAATHHVHADGSGGYPTIQSAIVACLAGDTVLVHPGTYRGPGNRGLDFHGVDLVLLSSDGPEVTVLDGEQQDRLVYLHSGESAAATIKGFTFQNGHMEETYAGGIHCVHASMTLKNCIVQDCSATNSGGIAIGYSDMPSELVDVL
ncbi:MAG: hypothetical protein JW819_10790, partial [Candidatus Krumholzibacteriota bacterium]|nr:hypothetical protein [Candidatus Krumholzibacteriota bacterium]